MKKFLILLCLGSVLQYARAQKQPVQPAYAIHGQIVGKGKAFKNRISLRWNVSNYQLFKQLVSDGVFIDRLTIGQNNKAEGNWMRISTDTLKAMKLKQIDIPANQTDTAVMVIAQTLYGKSEYQKSLSLIEQVKLQDMDRQNRYLSASVYAALSPHAAMVAGLAYEDLMVPDTSKKYVYRIYPSIPMHNGNKIDTGFVYVVASDLASKETFTGLNTVGKESSIMLKWPKENSPFTGYYIERSEDLKHFKRLNESIYLPATDTVKQVLSYYYLDSVPNYKRYYYRVMGVNSFGEQVYFEGNVMGMARDQTPAEAPNLKFELKDKNLRFSWNKTADKDVKGYYLLKGRNSNASDGLATSKMFLPTELGHQINLDEKFKSAYYRLMVADTAGNVSYSNSVYVFLPDTIAPMPPTGLKGKIDSLGQITLNWNLDQTGEAIRGYRVFTANQRDHEFIAQSQVVEDTTYTFKTTLKTLTKHLYVKLVAIDANFNNSKMSAMIELKRPDTIPPSQPVFKDYYTGKTGIRLNWSTDVSEDFSHYLLYRKEKKDSTWTLLKTLRTSSYTDSTFAAGKAYQYSLRAVDSTGLKSSFAFPLYLQTGAAVKNFSPDLKISFNEKTKESTLQWNKPAVPTAFYVIYKDSGSGLAMFKSVDGAKNTFMDPQASAAAKYGIKAVYADQTASEVIPGKP